MKANKSTTPKVKALKFIVSGVTGVTGGQKDMTQRSDKNAHAKMLLRIPNRPGIFQGPQYRFPGPTLSTCGSYGWIPPCWMRRQRSNRQQSKYDEYSPATLRFTMLLNATAEPRVMSERSTEVPVVNAIVYIGMDVRRSSLIYNQYTVVFRYRN
jgi:hypothetical protein